MIRRIGASFAAGQRRAGRWIQAAIAVAALLASAGCNDDKFLTEEPIDFVGPTNFYRTQADALAAINGVYAAFENTSGTNYYGGFFVMLVPKWIAGNHSRNMNRRIGFRRRISFPLQPVGVPRISSGQRAV